jgi:hypothetical protein
VILKIALSILIALDAGLIIALLVLRCSERVPAWARSRGLLLAALAPLWAFTLWAWYREFILKVHG